MLYTNGISNFEKLSKALQAYGVSEETLEIIRNYLDLSKERDNELLKKIQPVSVSNNWQRQGNLDKALRHEIIKARSEELSLRYILVAYSLFGNSLYFAVMELIPLENTHSGSQKKVKEFITNALSQLLGDKTEACILAISAHNKFDDFNTRYYYYYSYEVERKSPQVCMDALEFLNGSYNSQSLMCAYTLEQLSDPNDPLVKKALALLKNLNEGRLVTKEYMLAISNIVASKFDDKFTDLFKKQIKHNTSNAVGYARQAGLELDFIFTTIENTPLTVNKEYISTIAGLYSTFSNISFVKELDAITASSILANNPPEISGQILKDIKDGNKNNIYFSQVLAKHIKNLAESYTEDYLAVMSSLDDMIVAVRMEDVLKEVKPEAIDLKNPLKIIAQRKISLGLSKSFKNNEQEIRDYLLGDVSLKDTMPFIKEAGFDYSNDSYYKVFGFDDFMKRCATLLMFSAINNWVNSWRIQRTIGVDLLRKADKLGELFFSQDIDPKTALEKCERLIECSYDNKTSTIKGIAKGFSEYADIIADTDVLSLPVDCREIYLLALSKADFTKYKSQILALSADTSKAIKSDLVEILEKQENVHDDVLNLLSSKKIGQREIALSVIEKRKTENYTEELKTAFDKEKSEKIKVRIASLIGIEYGTHEEEKSEKEKDVVKELVGYNRSKRTEFLFKTPFKSVHFFDGSEVPQDYLKALLICYSELPSVGISQTANSLAEKVKKSELENFAVEVFSKWVEAGATAKTKWVMWFCGVHGGTEMINTLMHYIKEWSEQSRGAIASEAVKAMAVNGSSLALMNVDTISRKFKHRQVRSSAVYAIQQTADILGITAEELADRIVPDMGFDENMCRTFDYGKRKFSVYLTPSLEIEIFNGEKKVKSMPKPSGSDDPEIANASYNAFKEMKKQMKTVVANQKQRLEYVLICDRKWTSEKWTALFVKNPVMHCFAVGLIWGVYENGKLSKSFRYMDDGSFTTSDEDEYEIPENAEIGLVHPVELSEDEKNIWIEQLSDYEIVQPFPQLARQTFTPEPDETGEILRFDGKEMNHLSLLGKMTKLGWYKGTPQDAGFFYEFTRTDVSEKVKDDDGKYISKGYTAELTFSGMSADGYSYSDDDEQVTLEKLCVYTIEQYNTVPYRKLVPVDPHDLSKRYFSELILQITSL